MKVISILNQKGGVGKTTTTYNIGTVLAQKGYRVLMIDSDSQASLTLATGNDPLALKGLSSVYDGVDARECIYQLPAVSENLYLLPSSLQLAKTELELMATALGRERKLAKALKALSDTDFDYIFIDCPPALSMLTLNALMASDFLVAPCETSALSTYALEDLISTVDEVHDMNGIRFLGVVATRYAKNAGLARRELADLEADYPVLGVIKESTAARRGLSEGLPVVVADRRSDVAKAYVALSDKLLEVMSDE